MAAKTSSHWPITLTNGAVALLSIALPLALVRILSPDQVGRYNIFFLYVVLCPGFFLTGGLTTGLYLWAGKYPEAKAEVRQSWTLLIVISLPLCAIGLVGVHWIAPLIKIPPQDLQLVLLSIPFAIASIFFEDLLIARGDIWKGSWYGSGSNVFRTASLLAAAWWTRKIEMVFWVFFIGAILRTLIGWLLVRKSGEIEWVFSRPRVMNVLRYAVPVSLAALGGMGIQSTDHMILSFRLTPASYAFYAMGCLSIPPLEIFETSVNRVLIPRLSQTFTDEKYAEAAAIFSEGVSELFRYLLPATIALMIYSRPIVRILFTERYLSAADFLRVYALAYFLLAFPFGSVARAKGDGAWILQTSLIFGALTTIATWWAAIRWGAMAALIAVLSSQVLMKLYALLYARRMLRAPFSEFIPFKEILQQSGLVLISTAVALSLRPFFMDMRVWFLVTGSIFTLIYLGATYLLFLRKHFNSPGPIHILELAQTLGLGGSERTVYSLAQTLHEHKRFRVTVATYDHPEGQPSLVPLFAQAGIPLVQWQKGKGFSIRSVWQLVRLTFSEETRILHVHDLGPLIYGSLAKFFSFGRVRLVVTVHTLLDIEQSKKHRLYYTFFLRFPDRIIAVSPAVQTGLLALGVNSKRMHVIPNGAAFSCIPLRHPESTEVQTLRKQLAPHLSSDLYSARWLLCLARLSVGKGQDVVLNVWEALPKDIRAGLALFIVGEETDKTYGDSLRRRIRQLPDAERIIMNGPSERPQDWIQSADVFISGSLHEGMPLAPLEAAGSGLPTILSEIEGHRFLGPWATYFDPRKPQDGAAKIREILTTMKANGEREFFENKWKAAASVRQRWGTPAMRDSYVAAFETT